MTERKIITNGRLAHWGWTAVFDDYDGAEDSRHPIGTGATEAAAIADLWEQEDADAPPF